MQDLLGNKELIEQINYDDFREVDKFTFDDIIEELKKPGRDPRKKPKSLNLMRL